MKTLLTVTAAITFLSVAPAAFADGPMVHNANHQDQYTGYYTVPYEPYHYSKPSDVHFHGIATKSTKKTVKRSHHKIHFKTRASKIAFDRWYFATHKNNRKG